MPAAQEITVSATEFKAKCLDLMKQVSSGKLRRVHVTNRGKPLVTVTPEGVVARKERTKVSTEKPWSAESIFGCMKGEAGVPEDFDWSQSPYTDAELEQHEASFLEKFKHLL